MSELGSNLQTFHLATNANLNIFTQTRYLQKLNFSEDIKLVNIFRQWLKA